MDKKTQLIPFLEGLGRQLESEYERLNWGGCCVIAGLIGGHLENFTDTKVVVFNGWRGSRNIDDMREDIIAVMGDPLDKKNWCMGFDHVMLEIEVDGTFYLVDSNGVNESEGFNKYNGRADGHLTMEEAQALGNSTHGWNSTFDRDQIPDIEETINEWFDQFSREVAA